MPTLPADKAIERLAAGVETATPAVLAELRGDTFPDFHPGGPPSAVELAQRIRNRLETDEIVDLWNVVFPSHHNVWYDEETAEIHYDELAFDHAEID